LLRNLMVEMCAVPECDPTENGWTLEALLLLVPNFGTDCRLVCVSLCRFTHSPVWLKRQRRTALDCGKENKKLICARELNHNSSVVHLVPVMFRKEQETY